MASHSNLKVGGDFNGEDKISQLPDELLSRILSFLGTKSAVRTSILSTRWKYIWASVPSFDFIHECQLGSRSESSNPTAFVSFVDRAFHVRGLLDIHRFRLHYFFPSVDLCRIDGWIRNAISRNVVELDLLVRVYDQDTVEKIELPKTLFLCKTLVVLRLDFNCYIYDPPKLGCFPNLKVLHIKHYFPDKDFLEKVFTFFPLVEDLAIHGTLSGDISGTFKLFVPELKRLTIDFASAFNVSYEDPCEYFFSINAPKLELLHLSVWFLPSIVFDNAKSLVKAVMCFSRRDAFKHEHFVDRATTLLAGISNVQHLSLSVHSLAASCMPAFDNLKHLKLVIRDDHHWVVLPELLSRTPNLGCLELEHNAVIYSFQNISRVRLGRTWLSRNWLST